MLQKLSDVMNLAVCDCLMCVLGPMYRADCLKTDYLAGWRLFYNFFVYCVGMASFTSITSISIDGFLMIAYPIRHRTSVKGKGIVIWLAIKFYKNNCSLFQGFFTLQPLKSMR